MAGCDRHPRPVRMRGGNLLVHWAIAIVTYPAHGRGRARAAYAPSQAGLSKPAHGVMYGLYHMFDPVLG